MLDIDDMNKRVYLLVLDNNIIVERESYWEFDTLKEKLWNKLHYLAYIEADVKYVKRNEYFKYSSISFYVLKDFDTFLYLLRIAKICVSFLASYDYKKNTVISHGVSFSIKPKNINLLFNPL